MIKKEHSIWVERYRSDNLENYLCSDEIRSKIQEFIDKQDLPHIGLFGLQGSGKTTLAKLLTKHINCDYIYLNAAENRSMDDIKEKVGQFASTGTFKPLKIVILDEATHILQASQVLLLNIIETYSLKTRFILTGNYPERLIPPLKSRLQEFNLIPPIKPQVAKHIVEILDKEEVEYKLEDIKFIINKFYPDIRKTINNCQKYTIDNKLIINQNEINNEEAYLEKIINELKKPSYKSFNNIRQIVADAQLGDYSGLYRELYNHLDKFAKGNEGSITCIIEEIIYHSNFRIDQEIGFMSAINRILEIILQKKIIRE